MGFSKFHIEVNSDLAWRLFIVFIVSSAMITSIESAFAASVAEPVIGATLCRVVELLSGSVARAIATIAIFMVGVGLFIGKASWHFAFLTVIGVVITFGAPKLVPFLTNDTTDGTCLETAAP